MIFQITGYPRSGTAWLTTMFNLAPEVMAYHELAMRTEVWKAELCHIQDRGLIAGDIGTYQYFPKAVIHNSRKVFINRNPEVAQERVSLATGSLLDLDMHLEWKRMADNWIAEWHPEVIEYDNLFKLETLEALWYYCVGKRNVPFPDGKVEQLLKFNIQLHEPAKALANPGAITRLAELL